MAPASPAADASAIAWSAIASATGRLALLIERDRLDQVQLGERLVAAPAQLVAGPARLLGGRRGIELAQPHHRELVADVADRAEIVARIGALEHARIDLRRLVVLALLEGKAGQAPAGHQVLDRPAPAGGAGAALLHPASEEQGWPARAAARDIAPRVTRRPAHGRASSGDRRVAFRGAAVAAAEQPDALELHQQLLQVGHGLLGLREQGRQRDRGLAGLAHQRR